MYVAIKKIIKVVVGRTPLHITTLGDRVYYSKRGRGKLVGGWMMDTGCLQPVEGKSGTALRFIILAVTTTPPC